MTASNLSPARAVALETDDCRRTEIGVPAGTLKAADLSAPPKGACELPPVLAGILLQPTASSKPSKIGRNLIPALLISPPRINTTTVRLPNFRAPVMPTTTIGNQLLTNSPAPLLCSFFGEEKF